MSAIQKVIDNFETIGRNDKFKPPWPSNYSLRVAGKQNYVISVHLVKNYSPFISAYVVSLALAPAPP